jgi:hypothetical protein
MALFEGLNPQRKYALVSKLSDILIFEFTVRSTAPPVLSVLSGPHMGKTMEIDEKTTFIPTRFKIIDIGEAPKTAGVYTAAYHAETAWERIDKMLKMKEESEKLKAMAPINNSQGLVPGSEPEKEASETSNAVFWGVTAYHPSQRKTIIRQIYMQFFKGQHNIIANDETVFASKFNDRKTKLIANLKEKGIDPTHIDFNAGWTDFKNRDIIAEKYRSAIAELDSPTSSQPPTENNINSGSSIENIKDGGRRLMRKSRKRTNGPRRTRSQSARRRR